MTRDAFLSNPAPLAGAAAALAVILSFGASRHSQNSNSAPGPAAAPGASPQNPAYRVQVYPLEQPKLPVTGDWTLQYQFTVPPLPSSPTWDYKKGTLYQWGDVDFDAYGSGGKFKLSDYRFNQIVPQLILGNVLDRATNYQPSWDQRSTWAIQAQYFWRGESHPASFAQTGSIVPVNPGDEITTVIRYSAEQGAIAASIQDNAIPGAAGRSAITILRPFPNEPTLFTSWQDFFTKAAAKSKTSFVLATPAIDVETDYLDEQTVCGLPPLTLTKISIPGIPAERSAFGIQQLGGFTCARPVVKFNF